MNVDTLHTNLLQKLLMEDELYFEHIKKQTTSNLICQHLVNVLSNDPELLTVYVQEDGKKVLKKPLKYKTFLFIHRKNKVFLVTYHI